MHMFMFVFYLTMFVMLNTLPLLSLQNSESAGSLFRLAAVLLHEELLTLADLYPHVWGLFSHVIIMFQCCLACDNHVTMLFSHVIVV